jgi:FtsZ-interacting cell division protein ZipA
MRAEFATGAAHERDGHRSTSDVLNGFIDMQIDGGVIAMDTQTLVIIVLAVALVAVVGWIFYDRRRSAGLKSRFGPEYDRVLDEADDRRTAEAELDARRRRVDELDIRPLPQAERDRYAAEWKTVQARFVDEPAAAISEADRLIGDVMKAQGYPVADFEQRAADVSVDHPAVVEHYRAAHAIATTEAEPDAETTTEDLRQAMVHYRALFEDLLGMGKAEPEQRTAV